MDERERERRRRNRERRRRQKRKQRFVLILIMILLAALLIFGIVKAVSFFTKDKKEDTKVEQESDKEEIPDIVNEEEKEVEILVSLAGDCTLGRDENQYGNTFPAKYDEVNDPSYFFAGVQSAFANDDLTIVNFEGTLTESTNRADKTFAFKGDPSYTEILKQGSIEAVNLANNHSKDYGLESFEDTKKYLNKAGIINFGYEETAVIDVKGIKVGLIGTYELATGIECKEQLIENINKVKEEGAVLIIVNFHWGIEREYYPNAVQKELAHAAIDNGADLVVGHHPHVLQGIETYNGKKIVYSLGNFCFGGNKNPSDKDTMIFQQTFTIKGDEILEDENVNIIPCSLSSVSSLNDYQPTILEGSEAQRVLDKINECSEGL